MWNTLRSIGINSALKSSCPGLFFGGGQRLLMTASISLQVYLNCSSGLDLVLVCAMYPETCPFLLHFPILWHTGFCSKI